ncbi:DNA-binding transcriptional regulator, MerR family [Sinosporangium album]|uniref:DNA-binding transcriptional regulator, MerR family n=1 Tax=Sinosporangium album TaxID=504805 RepID=A0A1G8KKI1_9ACTN|nr:MerR family transcriptional regulator [Sinosporangium album]SDI43951.1 DNA-binding transcriptional regulator, MerR family [Sinosporangium album]
MRIGELAALIGVSTRTIRHYHQQGVMPEPERTSGGYREYQLRDAVLLARVRRLTELGLSLAEVRDVLADSSGTELREMLKELDHDLACQQEAIEVRRARLAVLISKETPHPDDAVSPELAELLGGVPLPDSAMFRADRKMLALMDTTADPALKRQTLKMMSPLREPEAMARGIDLYRRIDELADADVDDPRIEELAVELIGHIPQEMAESLRGNLSAPGTHPSVGDFVAEMGLSPAQSAVIRRAMHLLADGRGR